MAQIQQLVVLFSGATPQSIYLTLKFIIKASTTILPRLLNNNYYKTCDLTQSFIPLKMTLSVFRKKRPLNKNHCSNLLLYDNSIIYQASIALCSEPSSALSSCWKPNLM